MSLQSSSRRLVVVGISALLLAAALFLSLFVGASTHSPGTILSALKAAQWNHPAMETITYIRLPRGILAALIGAALAVAGAIMQLITRNPLASPQTLGVNATAALAMVFFIVTGIGIGGGAIPAFLGACVGGCAVMAFSLISRRGHVVLALAGMAVHLLCTALIQGLAVLNERAVDVVFWMNGSVAGAQWGTVRAVAPIILVTLLVAVVAARPIQALGLGREVATGLGIHYVRTMCGATALVIFLAGAAVSAAGPIGFVGLMVPHIVRAIVGRAPGLEFPLCALGGAILLVLADTAARVILWPTETPVGVLTAMIGAPAFLLLASRAGRGTS